MGKNKSSEPAVKFGFILNIGKPGYNFTDRIAQATVTLITYQERESEGSAYLSTEHLCYIRFQTHELTDEKLGLNYGISPIQPADCSYSERYVEWYSGGIEINNLYLRNYDEKIKQVSALLAKINKTREKYNLGYRYSDLMQCFLETLVQAGFAQIKQHNSQWYVACTDGWTRY